MKPVKITDTDGSTVSVFPSSAVEVHGPRRRVGPFVWLDIVPANRQPSAGAHLGRREAQRVRDALDRWLRASRPAKRAPR